MTDAHAEQRTETDENQAAEGAGRHRGPVAEQEQEAAPHGRHRRQPGQSAAPTPQGGA
ncbi:hypothetical protein [Streptomyces sp. SCSIO ZS0520]|uniref:hypothetical protein n=1 Tax=Streptomyces sp. SCSIO ZS0520 TaxID=2892996 RepID=UPI0021DA34A8|nr:hypothetical protein [Streptomyces sp. SCSIO ZS0520]